MTPMTTNEMAGPGEVFVCAHCGRRSRDRNGHHKIHSGWDRSCTINAVKYRVKDLVIAQRSGIVTGVREGARPSAVMN
jgi:hypothetical protein